jgi:fructose-1,6-bisphosphatase I
MPVTPIVTIERFIVQQERLHPGATGELSDLLYDIALAAKVISGYVRRAGLLDVLGRAGRRNVQGEEQQKLDILANETIKNAVGGSGRVCVLASEEEAEPILPPPEVRPGKYVLLFDPLDGSSNIDVNVSIGTIFSIYRRISPGGPGTLRDLLRRGSEQVAAGYVIYGSSTVLVYSSGQGVHGFTLDPSIGEFLLWNAHIKTPPVGPYYSVNESHWTRWSEGYRKAVGVLKGLDGRGNGKNARYIGSLVADFHRNLLAGGIFLYPGESAAPQGKLRLLYEAAPLALIAEQAGGAASDGVRRILDLEPRELHQRTPLVIGSREDVALVQRVLEQEAGKAERS